MDKILELIVKLSGGNVDALQVSIGIKEYFDRTNSDCWFTFLEFLFDHGLSGWRLVTLFNKEFNSDYEQMVIGVSTWMCRMEVPAVVLAKVNLYPEM